MFDFNTFLSLIIIISIIVFGVIQIKDFSISKSWTLYKYALVHFIIFYALIPLVYIFFSYDEYQKDSQFNNSNSIFNSNQTLIILIYTAVFFCFLSLSYYLFNFKINFDEIKLRLFFNKNTIQLISILISVLSFFSLVFFIYGLGGFESAIINSALIRAGLRDEIEFTNQKATFFFRFAFWSIIPLISILSFKNLFSKNRTVVFFVKYLPIFTLFVLYIFLAHGRQYILDFILVFILSYLLKKGKLVTNKLLLSIPIFLILQVFLKLIFNYLAYGKFESANNDSILSYLFSEFGFPFLSIGYSIFYFDGFHYFADFFNGLFGTILPSLKEFPIELTHINSKIALENLYTTIAIPCGIIASGIYNLGVLGLILTSVLTGFLLRFADNFFLKFISFFKNATFLYAFFITHILVLIRTGSVRFFYYDITFVMLFIVLLISFRFKLNQVK